MVGSYYQGIDTHIQALSQWDQKITELINNGEIDYHSDDDTHVTTSREIESNKLKCLALFLLANISFINSIVDSSIFKALCISFFYKNYHLPYEPIFIFTYLIETFKLNLDYPDQFTTPLKRGEYIFRLLRTLKTLKGTHDIITMIYVCISRNYGICSRIVSKYPSNLVLGTDNCAHLFSDSSKQQSIWCEFFDTKDRIWKCVDFSTPKFDKDVYKYNESSSYLEELSKTNEKNENDNGMSVRVTKFEFVDGTTTNFKDRDFEVEMEFQRQHRNYLYIHRNNKMFIYKNLDKPEVVSIVVFPKYTYRLSRMLLVREYPFESLRRIERLKESFSETGPSSMKRRKLMRSPPRNIFILSCNIGGMVSEVTSKYVQKELSYLRTSTFITWFNTLLMDLNGKRIQSHMYGGQKNKDSNVNRDLMSSDIDILNANLLENVDIKFISNLVNSFPIPTKKSHFINHPIYVLKSQIKRNYALKNGSLPVSSFGDELVYLKSDMAEVKTKFGWFKDNRKVKPDAIPVVISSQMYNKKYDYYTKDQTEPLKQDNIYEVDKFTINLSGKRYVPLNSVYIRGKKRVELEVICHKYEIFYKRVFSSLHYEDGSLKPKLDGILIRSDQLESFLKLYDGEIGHGIHGQLSEQVSKSCKFWKNVFKTLLNSPPVNKVESSTTVKTNIHQHTSKFLNQLI